MGANLVSERRYALKIFLSVKKLVVGILVVKLLTQCHQLQAKRGKASLSADASFFGADSFNLGSALRLSTS